MRQNTDDLAEEAASRIPLSWITVNHLQWHQPLLWDGYPFQPSMENRWGVWWVAIRYQSKLVRLIEFKKFAVERSLEIYNRNTPRHFRNQK